MTPGRGREGTGWVRVQLRRVSADRTTGMEAQPGVWLKLDSCSERDARGAPLRWVQKEGRPRVNRTPRSLQDRIATTNKSRCQTALGKALSPTRPADRMSSAMRCGASEPIRLRKLSCAREGANLGGGWSRARDPRLPVSSTPLRPCSPTPKAPRARSHPTILRELAVQPAQGRAAAPGSRNPALSRRAKPRSGGRLGHGGTSNAVRRGSAPCEVGCLNLRGAKRRGLGSLGTARAGASEPGPLPEPGARRLPTPRSRGALTVAEAQRSQHEGQHDADLGIHGTGRRRADGGRTRRGGGGGE